MKWHLLSRYLGNFQSKYVGKGEKGGILSLGIPSVLFSGYAK